MVRLMDKFSSRKLRAAWFLTLLFTALLALPGLASFVLALFGSQITFNLMPVEYYVTFMTGIWFAYFGANVVEKHKSFVADEATAKAKQQLNKSSTSDSGGQPEDVTND